jgi:hypothetical protein
MKISRGELLSKLNEASIGLGQGMKKTVAQSDCFIFTTIDEVRTLVTFDDEIMVRIASPLDFDVIVQATELLAILARIPDDEITVSLINGEFRIKGKMKTRVAGLVTQAELAMPLDQIAAPGKWHRLGEGAARLMQQAAYVCGDDEAQYLATCVHVTPDRVEACDNKRMFRADMATGFPGEILLPATSLHELEGLEILKVSIGEGWSHFKTSGGAVISLRCSHEPYHAGLDAVLEMADPVKLVLPAELKEIVQRAEVFQDSKFNTRISIRLSDGLLTITSRKESGWYREKKGIDYAGRDIFFEIQPQFLVEMLERTRDVLVDDRKMKAESSGVQFVVTLSVKEEEPEEE